MKIVKSTKAHAVAMIPNIRKADMIELSKAGVTISDALLAGLDGEKCYTALIDDKPVMMFGLVRLGLDMGLVWALGTDEVLKERKEFLRQSKVWRDTFLNDYSRLVNFVDTDNDQAIRWLRWLGANFDKPVTKLRGDFMRFEINV